MYRTMRFKMYRRMTPTSWIKKLCCSVKLNFSPTKYLLLWNTEETGYHDWNRSEFLFRITQYIV